MEITSFSVIIGLGASLGLGWVAWRAQEDERERWVDAGLWVLLGSLLGARLAFAGENWGYFNTHLGEIPQVWQGGLVWYGGVVGGALAAAGTSILWRAPLGELADGLMPLAVVLAVSAWLAGWLAGKDYGFAVSTLWFGLPARDEWGVYRLRFPLQLSGALLTMTLFVGLDHNRDWFSVPGQAASLGLGGLAVIQGILAFLSGEPTQTWCGWPLDAWAGVTMGCLGLLIFGWLTWTTRRRKKPV